MSSCCRLGQGRQVAGSTERGALCMPAPETDSRAEKWPVTFYSDCSRPCHAISLSRREHTKVSLRARTMSQNSSWMCCLPAPCPCRPVWRWRCRQPPVSAAPPPRLQQDWQGSVRRILHVYAACWRGDLFCGGTPNWHACVPLFALPQHQCIQQLEFCMLTLLLVTSIVHCYLAAVRAKLQSNGAPDAARGARHHADCWLHCTGWWQQNWKPWQQAAEALGRARKAWGMLTPREGRRHQWRAGCPDNSAPSLKLVRLLSPQIQSLSMHRSMHPSRNSRKPCRLTFQAWLAPPLWLLH